MYYYNNYNIIYLYIYIYFEYLSYILSLHTLRSHIPIYCHGISVLKVIFHHTGKNILAFLIDPP